MENYSTWLTSSSLNIVENHDNNNGGSSTLRLLDDSPVRDTLVKVEPHTNSSNEAPTNTWLKDEAGTLMEELNRVNAENKRLTETLTVVRESYNDLKRQLMEYMNKTTSTKKRKADILTNGNNHDINHNHPILAKEKNNNNNNVESTSSDEEDSSEKPKGEIIKAKITKVAVRTEASDSTLILRDGYQWRKYGQKVTRDNPSPRAYFKCSFAPSCPVKKKVQRSLEDQSTLVATYEGEHNHAPPTQPEPATGMSRSFTLGSVPTNTTLGSTCPTVTLDLTKPKSANIVANDMTKMSSNTTSSQFTKFNSPEFQKLLAEQMASSLTKDPNFTSALAAAISRRFVKQSSSD